MLVIHGTDSGGLEVSRILLNSNEMDFDFELEVSAFLVDYPDVQEFRVEVLATIH